MQGQRRLEGRVAVVTGGAQGIGFGIAQRLAADGAVIVVADIAREAGESAAAKLGGTATATSVDIGDDGSVRALAGEIEKRFGRCEILVNNAAINADTNADTMRMEDYHRVIRVNQDGAVRMVLNLLPLIKKAPMGRRILNISSIQGIRGWPNQLAYATAKGALVNFTRALACDLAPHDILVNAIAPGFVDTPASILADGRHEYDSDWFRDIYVKWGRIPLRRYANPADIAGPAYFLCSDDSNYVTGQILSVDGGASATF